jgi:DNA polymerase-3 subunit beta
MKLLCTQENFKRAIHNCERMVSKRNTLPILNNILLEAEKGGLKISATNLEVGVSSKVGAKVEKEGQITVPAKLIGSFSANLVDNGENITLEVMEDKLKIKSGTNKVVIKGMSANDFPLIPSKSTKFLFELPGLEMKNVLIKVLPAAAINEARQELTGVNLLLGEKEVAFAATDSFRLAECKLKITEEQVDLERYRILLEKKDSFIIPSSTLLELNRIIYADDPGKIKIAIEEGQIFFETDGTKLVSRLINGKYPDYKHIMPEDYKTHIVGEKSLLQGAVKMASIFSPGASGEITLKIDSPAKKIFMLSSSAEAGENSTELNFDITGPSQEVVFNAKYLLDGINIAASSKVAVLLNSESTPAAVKEIDEKSGEVLENFTYIVMPIKN